MNIACWAVDSNDTGQFDSYPAIATGGGGGGGGVHFWSTLLSASGGGGGGGVLFCDLQVGCQSRSYRGLQIG